MEPLRGKCCSVWGTVVDCDYYPSRGGLEPACGNVLGHLQCPKGPLVACDKSRRILSERVKFNLA